ncbi:Ribonuclease [Chelonia mydas]|uniref:Ribonuclease n=1 Tax=Chelonia mydas TaxID=8469 RepID=M7BPD2_CHEMY|nr:Ribonuclease [Chelonia mydas]
MNQHIDFPRSSAPNDQGDCKRLMQRRGLTCPACKASNIFIHAPFNQVQNICGCGGNTSTETSMPVSHTSTSPSAS